MHSATSPSTVQASPLAAPHPLSLPNGTAHREKSSDVSKQRTRLACAHCRKSKIRCVPKEPTDDFTDYPCKICAKNQRKCVWPESASSTTVAKSKNAPVDPSSIDREPKKRRIKSSVEASDRSHMVEDDIYSSHFYTDAMWEELYNIFKQHYATELPFLHEPTFLERLKQTKQTGSLLKSDHFTPLLLAFLALTIPFYKGIERQSLQQSRRVARMYADKAESKLNNNALAMPEIEVPQALLM